MENPRSGWQFPWQDPVVLVSFALSQHPPTLLGAQSWCSSPLMGGGNPALPSWALGTWHFKGAELTAEVVLGLGTHSAAQDLSALPVSLGAIGVSWDSPQASLPQVPEGHSVARPEDPRPQHGQRLLTAGPGAGSFTGPLFSGELLFSGLCSPALLPQEQEGGQELITPHLASLCAKAAAAGDVLTRTCGSWGIHLPHSGTL